MEPNSKTKNEIPDWVETLFDEFLDHQRQLERMLKLSIRGISMLGKRHLAVELRSRKKNETDSEYQADLDEAMKDREMAEEEFRNDFPLLHEQATIALWGSLETLVKSFVAGWLENTDGARQVEAVKKLRIKIGDYESLSPNDRNLWIVDQLDQSVGGPLRNGINRFETLLEPFGLNGNLCDEFKKTLFELSQIRHVIVHRSGKVDRRLLDACPWLEYRKGQRIKISHLIWYKYSIACIEYFIEISQRVRVCYGLGRREDPKFASRT